MASNKGKGDKPLKMLNLPPSKLYTFYSVSTKGKYIRIEFTLLDLEKLFNEGAMQRIFFHKGIPDSIKNSTNPKRVLAEMIIIAAHGNLPANLEQVQRAVVTFLYNKFGKEITKAEFDECTPGLETFIVNKT